MGEGDVQDNLVAGDLSERVHASIVFGVILHVEHWELSLALFQPLDHLLKLVELWVCVGRQLLLVDLELVQKLIQLIQSLLQTLIVLIQLQTCTIGRGGKSFTHKETRVISSC